MSRPTPRSGDLRAAWWTVRALRAARRALRTGDGLRPLSVSPPALPAGADRGVEAVLRRVPATCLEVALVRQRWLVSQGITCDVVIGVTRPGDGFKAHAWIDRGGPSGDPLPWQELRRIAA